MVTRTAAEQSTASDLTEVWGDVVSRRHLAAAIAVSVLISLTCFEVALWMFEGTSSSPAIDRAISMLIGIIGCVLAGAVCARAFAPKRIVADEGASDNHWRMDVLREMEADIGPCGELSDLSSTVLEEMKEVGLYELFRDFSEQKNARKVEA